MSFFAVCAPFFCLSVSTHLFPPLPPTAAIILEHSGHKSDVMEEAIDL
jgi:hypothetical protein